MIYLDNGATSFPKPDKVYSSIMESMRTLGANPGRGGHKMALNASRAIYEAREVLKDFFNCTSPSEIIFTKNCTEALNIVIKGVLKDGDHVLTSSMEHNSVLRPIKALESKGVEHTIINCDNSGVINLDDIKNNIRPNTKLIVLNYASNLIGSINPIRSIGEFLKEKNIFFLVDAAQAAGSLEIDVNKDNIDFLASSGHKSLLGPQGTGILYIKEGLENNINPLMEGGTGSKSQDFIQPHIMPDRFESGTPNLPAIIGLKSGVEYINEIGLDNIKKHKENLITYFLEELSKIEQVKIYGPKDPKKIVSVISINISNLDSSEVSFILDEVYGIATRPGLHCAPLAHKTINTLEQGVVRFSIGYFNSLDDIKSAINAIKNIVSEI